MKKKDTIRIINNKVVITLTEKKLTSKVHLPHTVHKELKAIAALLDINPREYMYKAVLEKIQKDKIMLLKPI